MKAKQFDDGLVAAVELAAQEGSGSYGGKKPLLAGLLKALAGKHGDAVTTLGAAAALGFKGASGAEVDARVALFLKDELRSKPIGFYTWNENLGAIFRQDRMLQQEISDRASVEEVIRALHGSPGLRKSYEGYLALMEGLTNPLANPDLRVRLKALDQGRAVVAAQQSYFFPPSEAHETKIVKELFKDAPVPPGFNLAAVARGRHSRRGAARPLMGWPGLLRAAGVLGNVFLSDGTGWRGGDAQGLHGPVTAERGPAARSGL